MLRLRHLTTWFQVYRKNTQVELALATLSFSQFGEDLFLRQFFSSQKDGFWVDVGAFHPIYLSNTHLLYKAGWRGLNVEPNPHGYAQFVRQRKRDINVQCAVSDKAGTVEFAVNGVYSGIWNETYLFSASSAQARRLPVQALPLRAILETHLPTAETRIDFMSVDCEGHDLVVLQSNDWNRFRPCLLLVEDHAQGAGAVDGFLAQEGYCYYCRLGLTKVFLEETVAPLHLPSVRLGKP